MGFSDRIVERAAKDKKTIALPESLDIRIIQAASMAQSKGIADIVLFGEKKEIEAKAEGADLNGIKFVNPATDAKKDEYANALYELRKHRGLTPEQAQDLVLDPVYFANMMLKLDDIDGIVAGAVHSTGDVLRPALQIIKAGEGVKTVSAFFVMTIADKSMGTDGTFVFADSGMVMDPNEQELGEIAVTSAKTARTLCEMEPRVAMLSFSTKGSAKHELVEKVTAATKIAKEIDPELILDGELQVDAAVVPSVSKAKAPDSPVEGKANVLIFPNLDAGNIGYKLVERFAKAEALGPIVQGLAKPVNDLSRGCNADDVYKVIAITCVQAQQID